MQSYHNRYYICDHFLQHKYFVDNRKKLCSAQGPRVHITGPGLGFGELLCMSLDFTQPKK